eukprot:TRINITY_DN19507_c0_g1_i1.p1 TRINITY_DN19507_c0_g1~~TRINITY_DN19507_c0_g1_i1.p1  ORF type:complete len:177 (-),score=38.25 TRINITY_DN19507_c0_g1_i1:55-585(-)
MPRTSREEAPERVPNRVSDPHSLRFQAPAAHTYNFDNLEVKNKKSKKQSTPWFWQNPVWVERYEFAKEKLLAEPIFTLGVFGTVGALFGGMAAVRRGDQRMSQNFMRARVLGQAFTLGYGGWAFFIRDIDWEETRRRRDAKVAEALEKAKEEEQLRAQEMARHAEYVKQQQQQQQR